ncbi:MAG: exodeoxyribonuclease VII small subunit [Mariprofundaceae bacterium]
MSKTVKSSDPHEDLNFEEALKSLSLLVEKLESGNMTLEESVAAFERGVTLSRRCDSLLDGAEQRLQILNEETD